MRIYSFYYLLLVSIFLFSCTKPLEEKAYNTGINIVPQPASVVEMDGNFVLNANTVFVTHNDSLAHIASYFQKKIDLSTGYDLKTVSSATSNFISLKTDLALPLNEEGYTLTVTPNEVSIIGKTPQGVFYGLQTLLQLLPAEIESKAIVKNMAWTAPCVAIEDEPSYGYRGMMLDVCRHFLDADFVKKQLDIMAMLKMNRFHWHLTDDHLWAIEVKKYPLLTQSIRHNADGTTHQGFYTQEQIKEIVDYASERFITIIPEIELPGHALAALTAYPELSCTGGPFQLRNKWGIEENVYCAGNEETFAFIEDVLDELIPLFPGEYFHIGGDECVKKKWKACAKCQKRIQEEGLKDEHELQSYFVHRIEETVLKHNKKMVGWDEILEGGLAPSATVMSWRGEEGGIQAATMGHDVIMTPAKWLYVDHGQGGIEVEPIAINFVTLLEKTYGYNPASEKIPAELRKHVLGAQCNMWTEYATTPEYTEYLLYPRMLAVSELNWTPNEKKDYNSFEKRINNQLVRLDNHGINYHIPLPEGPMADVVTITVMDTITFNNTQNLPMHYTTDGSRPTVNSPLYKQPIVVNDDTQINIATFLPSGKMSRVREVSVVKDIPHPAYSGITTSGMKRARAEGEFYFVADTKDAQWSEPIVVEDFNYKPDLDSKGAYSYTGYFEVPEDGVYYLSTEMDELEINGEVVLSNDGKLIRHSHNRTSLALEKGKHPFRLLFINNNIGGYPRIWNNKGFYIAQKDSSLKPIENVSYKSQDNIASKQ